MWHWVSPGCNAGPARRTVRRSARWDITAVCAKSRLRPFSRPSRRSVRYVVGVDVGGTNLVAGVLAEDGSEVHGVVSEPTLAAHGADAVTARIIKLAKASIQESGKQVEGVGIGSPDSCIDALASLMIRAVTASAPCAASVGSETTP